MRVIIAAVTSSAWIEHFYRNACSAQSDPPPSDLTVEDLAALFAVRPGELTALSSRLLLEDAQQVSRSAHDGALLWATRMFVSELQRQGQYIERAALLHARALNSSPWRQAGAQLLDTLPVEAALLLLRCRAQVAAKFFAALENKSTSPAMQSLAGRLATEHAGQVCFLRFAVAHLSRRWTRIPAPLALPIRRAVTFAVATRVWLRQRRRLRAAGETFGAFLNAALDQAALL